MAVEEIPDTPESPLFSKEIFLPLLDTGLQNHALKVGDCPNLKYSEASCLVGGLLSMKGTLCPFTPTIFWYMETSTEEVLLHTVQTLNYIFFLPWC